MINFDKKRFSGMNVLIVDDTLENLTLLGKLLNDTGLIISIARDGEQALDLIAKKKFDLVPLDIMMPGMDGYEVCRRLKAEESTKNFPVIFISAMTREEDLVKGFIVGGVDFITKPFKLEEVMVRIQTHLSNSKLNEEKSLLIKKLDFASKIDSLTSLPTRKYIREKIDCEQSKFEKFGNPFTIILSDIARFTNINHDFGNEAGDKIIKAVSDILKEEVGSTADVSRWSGKEFLILLPESKPEEGMKLVDKVRNGIENHEFKFRAHTIPVTMRFGVACQGHKGGKVEGLLEIAGQFLHQAKLKGRNEIVSERVGIAAGEF